MTFFSLLLVVASAVTLVVGVTNDIENPRFIWVSIGLSILALLTLVVSLLDARRATPVSRPVGFGPGAGRRPNDDLADRGAPAVRPVATTQSAPPVQAAPAAQRQSESVDVRPVEPAPVAAAPVVQPKVVQKPAASSAATTTSPSKPASSSKKAATKKKATAKKTAKKKSTAKKATAKKKTAKKATAKVAAGSTNGLSGIKGLGQAKVDALVDTFGSEKAAMKASIDDLTSVPGIGEAVAKRIRAHGKK